MLQIEDQGKRKKIRKIVFLELRKRRTKKINLFTSKPSLLLDLKQGDEVFVAVAISVVFFLYFFVPLSTPIFLSYAV